ncbi:hypothetical protein KSD_79760 [Ktedonobacter sp. SOSP1-85]|nr:hypothetical protein KSD_79760 [Ktedonobacter sp. SOSP1-85]
MRTWTVDAEQIDHRQKSRPYDLARAGPRKAQRLKIRLRHSLLHSSYVPGLQLENKKAKSLTHQQTKQKQKRTGA